MNGTRSRVRRAKENRAWDELFPEALGLIFNNLSLKEKLQVIPRVCKPWCKAVEGPFSWRNIGFNGWETRDKSKLDRMLRMLLPRSSAFFRELYVSRIDDGQLSFIADYARSLQVLSINVSSITDSMVERVAPKLSSLTTINLSYCYVITSRSLTAIGTNCKSLESLTRDEDRTWCPDFESPPRWAASPPFTKCHRKEGQAIAETMPKLKHLSIAYVNIDTEVALEILPGCPELESFNSKGCWAVHLGTLKEKYPHIKVVELHHEDSDDEVLFPKSCYGNESDYSNYGTESDYSDHSD